MEAARWCHSEQHHAATSCYCCRQIRGRDRWIRAATGQGLIGRAAAAHGRFTTRTCRCSFSNPAAGRDPVAPGLLLVAAGGRRPRPQNHSGARPRPLARGAPPRTQTTRTRRRTTWQRQFYSGTHGSTAKAMLLSPSPLWSAPLSSTSQDPGRVRCDGWEWLDCLVGFTSCSWFGALLRRCQPRGCWTVVQVRCCNVLQCNSSNIAFMEQYAKDNPVALLQPSWLCKIFQYWSCLCYRKCDMVGGITSAVWFQWVVNINRRETWN